MVTRGISCRLQRQSVVYWPAASYWTQELQQFAEMLKTKGRWKENASVPFKSVLSVRISHMSQQKYISGFTLGVFSMWWPHITFLCIRCTDASQETDSNQNFRVLFQLELLPVGYLPLWGRQLLDGESTMVGREEGLGKFVCFWLIKIFFFFFFKVRVRV